VRIGLDEVAAWIPAGEALKAHEWTSALPRISTAELAAALADEGSAVVLDVRGADEFAAGHVGGALNIAYTRLGARLAEIPNRRPVYVHCGSGLRASMAASFLAAKGVEVVHVDGDYAAIASRAAGTLPGS
jgi:hydroxyacylglutathione hydrolase